MSEIAGLTITPSNDSISRYAGASGDFNPIHLDEEFARSVGLPGRIVHGLWTMAQAARAATESGLGAGGPESLKRLEVRFSAMCLPGKEVTVTGSAGEPADGVIAVDLSVEQDGSQVIRRATADIAT